MDLLESPRQTRQARRRTSSIGNRSDDSIRRVSMVGSSLRRVSTTSYMMQAGAKKNRAVQDDAGSADMRRKNVRMENTYRMEPTVDFPAIKVRQIVKDALVTLDSHSYEPNDSALLAKLMSKRILDEVKQLNVERYKLVCLVSIGSKNRQGMRIASRCLWNTEYDTCISETMDKHTFYAIATVYGLYFE
ncbi:dynein light chain Tctex-type 5 [Nematostella vectensis]|uniref:dynein light chain Tctex-type 5 n=1 Tax=Nematostella vectensis TaxID=45351 RepID=UPI0020778DF4|nr:dynein light chain Tctex-type 5 [Nematostella vectensis]